MAQQLMVEQQAALMDFLDELLTEEPENAAPLEAALTDTGTAEEVDTAEQSAVESVPDDLCRLSMDGRIPIIPEWAGKTFQAMVFKVRELSLAIPLVELAGVLEWRPQLLDTGSAGGLCLGRYPHAGQSVTVFDTARFIFPAGQWPALSAPDSRRQPSHIILIDNGKTGLVCDAVYEVISIDTQQVNWRSHQTRRKWLAGTLLEQLIAVLDTGTTAEILAADTSR